MDEGLWPPLARWLENYNAKMQRLAAGGVQATPDSVRDGLTRLTKNLIVDIPPIASVVDAAIDGPHGPVSVRLYHPEPEKAVPVLIYLHGGGHVAGSVAVFDPICRKIALATGRLVISVDYRLAPEHPYPAALHDAAAVVAGYQELLRRLGLKHTSELGLAGDSAGGVLAATLLHQELCPDIDSLTLLYPLLDYTLSQPSVELFAKGYLLEKERIRWSLDQYFQGAVNLRDVSPLFMDIPADFPRTLIVSAGFCPLRDQARQYGEKLSLAGVAVTHHHYPGVVHAFLNLENLVVEDCQRCYAALARFFKK